MKLSVLIIALTITLMSSLSAWSATPTTLTPTLNLREQATAETHIEGQAHKSAKSFQPESQIDAQYAQSMLRLKDPRPEVITRTWTYFAGFTVQNFQARGSVASDAGGNFDLGNNSSAFMPGLIVGMNSSPWVVQSYILKLGLRGDASFASQGTSVKFPSGYSVNDARLNSTLLAMGPSLNIQWSQLPAFAFIWTPQFGRVNYTQTSANDFAHFSKEASYLAFNYGLDFSISRSWSLFAEYSARNVLGSNQEIALQNDNYELGAKVTW